MATVPPAAGARFTGRWLPEPRAHVVAAQSTQDDLSGEMGGGTLAEISDNEAAIRETLGT